jgi:hypothetical protein
MWPPNIAEKLYWNTDKPMGSFNEPLHIHALLNIANSLNQHTQIEIKQLAKNYIDTIRHRIDKLQKMLQTLTHSTRQRDGSKEAVAAYPRLLSLFR